jgi:hypothetical protein
MAPELKPVAIEQLPGSEKEPEKDGILRLPPEAEILQLLAFAICVGCDIIPGMRSTVNIVNTAPIENTNLCI